MSRVRHKPMLADFCLTHEIISIHNLECREITEIDLAVLHNVQQRVLDKEGNL